jgi:hypothetical protein
MGKAAESESHEYSDAGLVLKLLLKFFDSFLTEKPFQSLLTHLSHQQVDY